MKQSNALRRLEIILDEAVTNGDREQNSGAILLQAMTLAFQPRNIVDFYELLNKAEEEARKLNNFPKINRYIQVIEELHDVFILNHIWNSKWSSFANHIESRGVLNTLDALANYLHSQNPRNFLEHDFLKDLNTEFDSLLSKVIESDLSKELKIYLSERLEDILKAIRRYTIDGTEGLEKAAKSLVNDLALTEHNLKDEDKKNPIYQRVKAWGLSLVLFITPSPYDIVGAVPDIYEFWIPKFEELAAGSKKIERIICEKPNIQEVFEKASDTFSREPRKSILGRELKALPASKEDVENNIGNESEP